jgi:hypothetical protein
MKNTTCPDIHSILPTADVRTSCIALLGISRTAQTSSRHLHKNHSLADGASWLRLPLLQYSYAPDAGPATLLPY